MTTPDHPTVLERWRFRTGSDTDCTVLPDGCRDLIVTTMPDGRRVGRLSPLMDGTRSVRVPAGRCLAGYRLRPGVAIDERGLLGALAGARGDVDAEALLERFTTLSPSLADALDGLAGARRTVEGCARDVGVSRRSLERLVAKTGRPPVYWMQLARVRRAARALGDAAPIAASIADTADAHGYADQAHFTRECRRWLGTTPARLRDGRDARSRTTLALLREPGYGAPSTPVQSSTR